MIIFGKSIPLWLAAPILYFLWVSIGFVLKSLLIQWMQRISQKTKTHIDDLLVRSLHLPLTLLVFVSGGLFLGRILNIDHEEQWVTYGLVVLRATTIAAIVLFLDQFLRGLIREYASRIEALQSTKNIAQGLIRVLVIGLGLLILMDQFGLSITPILASLGIGSLAVALALQPTLENFFAGVQVITDRVVRLGQYIKLETGEEGYVEKIGWRSIWIRTLPNAMVIVPNKALISSKITNYYYPETELAVLVQVGVSYNSDLKHVEQVTIAVAQEVQKNVQGAVKDFEPFIRYHTFNQSSIDFTVVLRAHEYVDQYLIKHEFVKRLQERYAKENINIPFPIRTLDIKPELLENLKNCIKA